MKEKFKIQSRKIQFEGFDGSQLAGSFDFPQEIFPIKYVIVSHCFTCTKQTLTTARLSRGLAQAGYGVLRFDFTGLGDSEGVFEDTNFRSMVKDIECAANWLTAHYEPASLLIGHSMGGTASLAASQNACGSLSRIQKIVTLASPAYPDHVLHHFGSAMDKLQRGENAQIMVAGQAFPVKPGFVEDVQSYDMDAQMQGCNVPITAIRAGKDNLIGPQAAEQIMKFTEAESQLREVVGADHLFSDRNHAAILLSYVLDEID